MTDGWNGLGVGLGNLWRLADAETRSISPENLDGVKGRGGMATEGTGAGPGAELVAEGGAEGGAGGLLEHVVSVSSLCPASVTNMTLRP